MPQLPKVPGAALQQITCLCPFPALVLPISLLMTVLHGAVSIISAPGAGPAQQSSLLRVPTHLVGSCSGLTWPHLQHVA